MGTTITVGVDTHRDTLEMAALTSDGIVVDHKQVPNNHVGFEQALEWVPDAAAYRWAIEGSGSYGYAFTRFLRARHRTVVEIPTWRVTELRTKTQGRKNDQVDAQLSARADQHNHQPSYQPWEQADTLKTLTTMRRALVGEQTAAINRIHALLVKHDPDLASRIGRIRSIEHFTTLATTRLSDETATLVLQLEAQRCSERQTQINQLHALIKTSLGSQGHALMTITGIGIIGAGTLIAEIGHINRFNTNAQLASWAGTAPLDASSGKQQRHRLNRRGNRLVNQILHTAIITQLRHHAPAHHHITNKLTQGKTKQEAIRSAKRHLTRTIHTTLKQTT